LVSLGVDELYRTLNMGIGMVLVVAPENAQDIQSLIAEETWVIGVLDTQVPESPQVELR